MVAKIREVENGLLEAFAIKGAKPEPKNLIEQMAKYKVPAASIAVIEAGTVAWVQSYGALSAENTPSPATPETLFQAASISKPIAAATTLSLVDKGILDLDTDINHYLTTWKLPTNEYTQQQPVTLRNLLSHTAGLTVHGFPGYKADAELPTVSQILDGELPANTAAVRVDLLPNAEARYSGGGYTILQQLLEDVMKTEFAVLAKELVFEKLGMHHSKYNQPLHKDDQINAATAHSGFGEPISGKHHVYPELAAAGLWTTAHDLALFIVEIIACHQGRSTKLFSQTISQQMLIPVIKDFGLGVQLNHPQLPSCFEHGGSNQGIRCHVVGNVKDGSGAVVMTNGHNGTLLVGEVLRGVSQIYGWESHKQRKVDVIDVSQFYADYVGDYRFDVNSDSADITITQHDDRLLMNMQTSAVNYLLLPTAKDHFAPSQLNAKLSFQRNEAGEVMTLYVADVWKLTKDV